MRAWCYGLLVGGFLAAGPVSAQTEQPSPTLAAVDSSVLAGTWTYRSFHPRIQWAAMRTER